VSGKTASERRAPASGFEEFVERVSPDVLAYFLRRVETPDDAADCVAETLLVLWRRRSDLPDMLDDRRAWTFGIANGVLRNHRRSGLRRNALADRLRHHLVNTIPPAATVMSGELAAALRSLNDADRELIALVAWEGMSITSAAGILGIKPAAARARYSRARARLRHFLGS
jgi:RNA polymerase sigma-70 factor (ECF subfamily)